MTTDPSRPDDDTNDQNPSTENDIQEAPTPVAVIGSILRAGWARIRRHPARLVAATIVVVFLAAFSGVLGPDGHRARSTHHDSAPLTAAPTLTTPSTPSPRPSRTAPPRRTPPPRPPVSVPPAPPGDDSVYTPPATPALPARAGQVLEATTIAVRFTAAWARPRLSARLWWRGVAPYAEESYARDLRTVDPANVPASRVTGLPRVVSYSPALIVVDVPTDGGTARVTVANLDGRGNWKVTTHDWIRR